MSKRTTTPHIDRKLALSIRDAAAAISVSERTISALIATGGLGSVRVGRRRLVPRRELEKLITVAPQ